MNKQNKMRMKHYLRQMTNGELRQVQKFIERELRERKKKEKDNG